MRTFFRVPTPKTADLFAQATKRTFHPLLIRVSAEARSAGTTMLISAFSDDREVKIILNLAIREGSAGQPQALT